MTLSISSWTFSMQKEKEQSTDKPGRPESALLGELYPARDQWPMMTSFRTGRDKKPLGVGRAEPSGRKKQHSGLRGTQN